MIHFGYFAHQVATTGFTPVDAVMRGTDVVARARVRLFQTRIKKSKELVRPSFISIESEYAVISYQYSSSGHIAPTSCNQQAIFPCLVTLSV